MSAHSIEIVIAGDIVINGCDISAARNGSLSDRCPGVTEIIRAADLAVANLEAPVCDALPGIVKLGPHLRMKPDTLPAVRGLGFGAVCLANNHIMDHGPEGLRQTQVACESAGLMTFGAGSNLATASQPLVVDVEGRKVALLGMAEHEFSIARSAASGANPLDAISLVQMIRESADTYDDLIVLIHGGLEHFPYPTPGLQRFARFAVDIGASAVVCQHTHIVGCMELWRGRPIVYGQGNFLFQYPTDRTTWWEGVLVKLILGENVEAQLVPVASKRDEPGVHTLAGEERSRVLNAVVARSECVTHAGDLDRIFLEYAEQHARWYQGLLEALPRPLRKIDHRWSVLEPLRRPWRARMQYGVLSCESQREVILRTLEDRAGLYQVDEIRRCNES